MDITKHTEFQRVDLLIKSWVKQRPNGKAYQDNPEYWDKVSAHVAIKHYIKFYENKIQESRLELQIDPTSAQYCFRDIEVWESIIECLNGFRIEIAVKPFN